MQNIFLFSGLGADERALRHISVPGFKMVYVKWLAPQTDEKLAHYAGRIAQQITSPDAILIGLSFGGMMAIEVAKIAHAERVILIASAKNKKEIPWYYRAAGKTGLHRLLPAAILKKSNAITNWFFGAKTKEEKQLLAAILQDTDAAFLKWAIDKIVHWKNEWQPKKLFHIHGTADKILPVRFTKPDVIIKDGGHFMTLNKFEEINMQIKNLLLQ